MDSSVENLVAVYTADIENVNKEAFIQDIKMSFDIDEVESLNKETINPEDIINELKEKNSFNV